MSDQIQRLDKLTSKNGSNWLEQASLRVKHESWLDVSFKIGLAILRELRKKNLTQKDLAERMGVSPQQINKIVKGQENLSLGSILNLSKALGIDLLGSISKFQTSIDAPGVITIGSITMVYQSHSSPAHVVKTTRLQTYENMISVSYDRAKCGARESASYCAEMQA